MDVSILVRRADAHPIPTLRSLSPTACASTALRSCRRSVSLATLLTLQSETRIGQITTCLASNVTEQPITRLNRRVTVTVCARRSSNRRDGRSTASGPLRGYPETGLGKKADFLDSERISHQQRSAPLW